MDSERTDVLAGVRVLDLTSVMSGPFTTRMLADLGAEVVKVEPPGGDRMRTRPPVRSGHSSYFGALNCGKRSIVVDLKAPAGAKLVAELAASADVFVENYRPGVTERLGLGHAALAAANPRLIYCSISGFGQTGPSAAKPAYAPVVHAASGFDLATMGYQPGAVVPPRTGLFIADVLAGVYAFGAVQTALLQRERTGRGQRIDVSMLDAMLTLQVYETQAAQFPIGRGRPVYSPVRTSDGFVMVVPLSQRIFEQLCLAIGHPEWHEDPRLATHEARERNWDLLTDLIAAWTGGRSSAECEETLLAAGVPCSRYRDIAEVLNDPQLEHRGSLTEVADGGGTFRVPNPPWQSSTARVEARGRVAEAGVDFDAVLREHLGASPAEIAAWRAAGATGAAR